jgi:hypothetical protein
MLRVPTALLLHQTPAGRHHDWLVGCPCYHSDPGSPLWTARVRPSSQHWHDLGQLDLALLAPHRRAYLDYQGPISGGRGSVLRVDRGELVIHHWRPGRAVWEVHMQHFTGLIEATPVSDQTWRARVVG